MTDTEASIAWQGERTVVLVSRLQGNPQITVAVRKTGIAIALDIDEFVTAVLAQVDAPGHLFPSSRNDEMDRRIRAAVTAVVQGMKDETARVL